MLLSDVCLTYIGPKSRTEKRRCKACRLWTGGGPQRAYSGWGGGILCRHAHSLLHYKMCDLSSNNVRL